MEKFGEVSQQLINSESTLYGFFGFTSDIISRNLYRSFGDKAPFPDDVYKKIFDHLIKFTVGIKNKDLVACYDSITNFVYLSSIQISPDISIQVTNDCIQKMERYIKDFPVLQQFSYNNLVRVDPYVYIFIVYLNIIDSLFYMHVEQSGYPGHVPKSVEEESKSIKTLFKKFKYYYERKDVRNQCKVLIKLALEPKKLDWFLPDSAQMNMRQMLPPIIIYKKLKTS